MGFALLGIQNLVGAALSLSPGYLIAVVISWFGKEPWKAISFYFI